MKFITFSEVENSRKKLGVLSNDELYIIDINSIKLMVI